MKDRKIYNILSNMDFQYANGFDCETNREQAYDHYERCANDYCRCSTISPEITDFTSKGISKQIIEQFDIEYIIINKRVITEIEKVCDTITIDDFYCDVCAGYYGQELESITIDNTGILRKLEEAIDIVVARKRKIEKLNKVCDYAEIVEVDSKKVEKILIDEYGYLLDSLKNSDYVVIEVDTCDIVLPQKDYAKNLNKAKIKGYRNRQGICGIVKNVGDKFHVIDGYHRVTANLKKDKIKVILKYECKR